MAGKPQTIYTDRFLDVGNGLFYTEPVMWASENGIVTGYDNGMFGPSDHITREQLATMLYRYAKVKGKDVSKRGDLSKFPDSSYISEFAQEAVSWAVAEKIITGDQGEINPQGQANRAHAATMMMRYTQIYGK